MATENKKILQHAFKKHHRMDHGLRKSLTDLGLVISITGGSHYRLKNPENGKCTFISNTPSDRRSGINAVNKICKILE